MILLLAMSSYAQPDGMVLIEGFVDREVSKDSIAQATYEEFVLFVDKSNVNYQPRLGDLKGIEMVSMNKVRLFYFDRGILYINSYLDQFPNTKRFIVLKGIGQIYRIPLKKRFGLNIDDQYFLANEKHEKNYTYRKKNLKDLKSLIEHLEEINPLIPKL